MTDPRESLGRLVRNVWVDWALEQGNPKDSWLLTWSEIDDGQREVDMRIGEAVAEHVLAPLRDRVTGPDHGDHVALLGKRVRVKLGEHTVEEGVLLGFGDGGDFELEGGDGLVWHGWPMLEIEEVHGDR